MFLCFHPWGFKSMEPSQQNLNLKLSGHRGVGLDSKHKQINMSGCTMQGYNASVDTAYFFCIPVSLYPGCPILDPVDSMKGRRLGRSLNIRRAVLAQLCRRVERQCKIYIVKSHVH